LEAKMPLRSMTVTAVTMQGNDGFFTSSSAGNGETRQKRKMRINEWADLKHKALRESDIIFNRWGKQITTNQMMGV